MTDNPRKEHIHTIEAQTHLPHGIRVRQLKGTSIFWAKCNVICWVKCKVTSLLMLKQVTMLQKILAFIVNYKNMISGFMYND